MLVFIDESGCPGMKLGRGSTDFFTVAFLVFENEVEATNAENALARLRQELRLPRDFEFHYNSLKARNREAFYRGISPLDFYYFTATIEKAALPAGQFRRPSEFYRYACGVAFESAKPYLDRATIVIDATGGNVFRQELVTHLRRAASAERLIAKIKFEDSAANALIQMADMIAGAMHRYHSGDSRAAGYRKLISHREMASNLWPR
jgi:hypothetical protein